MSESNSSWVWPNRCQHKVKRPSSNFPFVGNVVDFRKIKTKEDSKQQSYSWLVPKSLFLFPWMHFLVTREVWLILATTSSLATVYGPIFVCRQAALSWPEELSLYEGDSRMFSISPDCLLNAILSVYESAPGENNEMRPHIILRFRIIYPGPHCVITLFLFSFSRVVIVDTNPEPSIGKEPEKKSGHPPTPAVPRRTYTNREFYSLHQVNLIWPKTVNCLSSRPTSHENERFNISVLEMSFCAWMVLFIAKRHWTDCCQSKTPSQHKWIHIKIKGLVFAKKNINIVGLCLAFLGLIATFFWW